MPEKEVSLVPIERAFLNDVRISAQKLAQVARRQIADDKLFNLFTILISLEVLKFRLEHPKPFEIREDVRLTKPETAEKYFGVLTSEKDALIRKLLEEAPENPDAIYISLGDLRVKAAELHRTTIEKT